MFGISLFVSTGTEQKNFEGIFLKFQS